MSEFPSLRFQGVGVLRPPNVSIVKVSGGVLPFFSFFIINNLQKATRLPPETLTIEGAIPLPSKNPDFRKSVNDSFCPFDSLAETALVTAAPILGSEGLKTTHPRPAMPGPTESEDRRGSRWGKGSLLLSESESDPHRWGKEFFKGAQRPKSE